MAGMLTSDVCAVHIIVYGRVQGVGFRAWTMFQARRFTITGWVQNSPDYSVEIMAEGRPSNLGLFIKSIKKGNSYSYIESISINKVKPRGFSRFVIM